MNAARNSFGVTILLLVIGAGVLAGVFVLGERLVSESRRLEWRKWLLRWGIKGLAIPLLIWFLMNIGISSWLEPFMPQVQAAQNRGARWIPAFWRATSLGFLVLSSYWSAVTLAWVLFTAQQELKGDARGDFNALSLTCTLAMSIPAVAMLLLGGWPTLGLAALGILTPIAGYAPGLLVPVKLPPMYARATARMKFGKYSEAEWEILHQLEKSEDDFQGWLMLAELYATRFGDLAEAEQTILEICDQPRTTPSQAAIALQRLADWQLEIAGDPDAARRSLQVVADRFKGMHLARMAQLRINQLPRTKAELQARKNPEPVHLPALSESPAPAGTETEADRAKALEAADDCVERLRGNPNDVAAREKLARLYTEHLQRADLGIEQLALLLDMPDQERMKRAEWLSLLAVWRMRHQSDLTGGRILLERVVRDFSDTPQALAAKHRLEIMARSTDELTRNPAKPG
jgi:hypothetical protein